MADVGVLDVVLKLQRKLQGHTDSLTDKGDYVLKVLSKLSRVPMTLDILQQTHVGKDVNQFRKWAGSVGDKAKSLVKKWKQLLPTSEVLPAAPGPTSMVLTTPINAYLVTPTNTAMTTPTRPTSEVFTAAQPTSEVKLTLAQYQAKRCRIDHKTRRTASPQPPLQNDLMATSVHTRKHKSHGNVDSEISHTVVGYSSDEDCASRLKSQHVDSEISYDIMQDLNSLRENGMYSDASFSLSPSSSSLSPLKKRHKSHHRHHHSSKRSKPSSSSGGRSEHTQQFPYHGSHSLTVAGCTGEMETEFTSKDDEFSATLSETMSQNSSDVSFNESSAEIVEDYTADMSEDPSSQSSAQSSAAKNKRKANFDSGLDAVALSKRSRTLVYSGRKNISGPQTVTSLFDLSMKILMDNIDAIEEVGGVPYLILEPVLQKCTATQLMRLEEFNPHFLEDSDALWEKHCKKEFKGVLRRKTQAWRDLYIDKLEEREERLKNLTANIKAKEERRKEPQRSAKPTIATRVPSRRGQRSLPGTRPFGMKPFERPTANKNSLMSKTLKMAKQRNVMMKFRPAGK